MTGISLLLSLVQAAAMVPAECKIATPAVPHPAALTRVHERLAKALDSDSFPALTVAVSRAGELIWSAAYGCSNLEKRTPARPSTPFVIASVTKPITATAIMILAERGLIDIDQPANWYLPQNARIRDGAGRAAEATIRLVLQHRAGLPRFTIYGYETLPQLRATLDDYLGRYAFLAYPAGERYEYSNIGYGVLQRIIEHVSGKTFGEFLNAELFAPLRMDRSSVGPSVNGSIVYYDAALRPLPSFKLVTDGAGFVFATAEDIVRFGEFHEGTRTTTRHILSRESSTRMRREHQSTGTPGGYYGTDWYYGFGFGGRKQSDLGHSWYGHEGGMPGTASVLRIWPDHQLVVAVISNGRNDFPEEIADSIADALIADYAMLRARDRARPRPKASSAGRLSALRGVWQGEVSTHAGAVKLEVDFDRARVNVNGREAKLAELERTDSSWNASSDNLLPVPEFNGLKQQLYYEFHLRAGRYVGFVMAYHPAETVFYAPFAAVLNRAAKRRP